MVRHPLVLMAALAPLAAAAQGAPEPQGAEIAGSHRVVAAHRFEPSTLVDDPFATTSVGTDVGYMLGAAKGPTLQGGLGNLTIGCCKDLSYGGILGQLDGSFRLADWLGLRLGLGTFVYSGIDRPSVISVGSGLKTSAHAQLVPGIELGDRVRAAALVGVATQPALDILVLSGLRDAIQSGSVEGGEILQTSNTLVLDAGASVAWAAARWLGVTASVEYVAPRRNGLAAFSANGIQAAAAVDMDVGALNPGTAFGLSAAYRIIAPVATSEFQAQQDVRAGVFYTGRPGLTVRGELGYRHFNIRQDQLLSDVGTFDVIVRYDW